MHNFDVSLLLIQEFHIFYFIWFSFFYLFEFWNLIWISSIGIFLFPLNICMYNIFNHIELAYLLMFLQFSFSQLQF